MRKVILFVSVFAFIVFKSFGQIPAGYYNSASGLTGSPLKTALYNIIKGHTVISYDALWNAYQTTDKNAAGKVWDMYSTCTFTFGTDQCGNYQNECDCYNREHSFPKSWFNDTSPMNCDLYHVYPTDGKVNGARGNYPFGTVGSPSYTSVNGGSKVGGCNYPGYTGNVFEPIDEYKGDFARTYFYMATRYENVIASWNYDVNGNAIMNATAYPAYETWFISLLLTWNSNDPVSVKETNRNNAVYGMQHNRNPFIDHPEYADAIWGPTIVVQNNLSNDFSIYPNPAKVSTTVSFSQSSHSDFTLNILNILGENVYTKSCSGNSVNNVDIDLNPIAGGTYFLKVSEANGKSEMQKLIIIK